MLLLLLLSILDKLCRDTHKILGFYSYLVNVFQILYLQNLTSFMENPSSKVSLPASAHRLSDEVRVIDCSLARLTDLLFINRL